MPQQPTQEYTTPLAAEQTQVFAGPNVTEAGPAQKKQKAPKTKGGKKLSKKKIGIISAIAVLVIALVAAFFYFQSTTRVEVTADKFIKAVDTKDYREAADLLSTDNDKWTKDEAESFITSMEDQGVDIDTELNRSLIMVERVAIRINLETKFLVWKKRTRNLGSSKNTV